MMNSSPAKTKERWVWSNAGKAGLPWSSKTRIRLPFERKQEAGSLLPKKSSDNKACPPGGTTKLARHATMPPSSRKQRKALLRSEKPKHFSFAAAAALTKQLERQPTRPKSLRTLLHFKNKQPEQDDGQESVTAVRNGKAGPQAKGMVPRHVESHLAESSFLGSWVRGDPSEPPPSCLSTDSTSQEEGGSLANTVVRSNTTASQCGKKRDRAVDHDSRQGEEMVHVDFVPFSFPQKDNDVVMATPEKDAEITTVKEDSPSPVPAATLDEVFTPLLSNAETSPFTAPDIHPHDDYNDDEDREETVSFMMDVSSAAQIDDDEAVRKIVAQAQRLVEILEATAVPQEEEKQGREENDLGTRQESFVSSTSEEAVEIRTVVSTLTEDTPPMTLSLTTPPFGELSQEVNTGTVQPVPPHLQEVPEDSKRKGRPGTEGIDSIGSEREREPTQECPTLSAHAGPSSWDWFEEEPMLELTDSDTTYTHSVVAGARRQVSKETWRETEAYIRP